MDNAKLMMRFIRDRIKKVVAGVAIGHDSDSMINKTNGRIEPKPPADQNSYSCQHYPQQYQRMGKKLPGCQGHFLPRNKQKCRQRKFQPMTMRSLS